MGSYLLGVHRFNSLGFSVFEIDDDNWLITSLYISTIPAEMMSA